MSFVKPKKKLGQHFLKDQKIAQKIVDSLSAKTCHVVEVGAGMGVLTQYLLQKTNINLHIVEIDQESVVYLKEHFPNLDNIYEEDFLQFDLSKITDQPFSLIGNFPYNISSQIFFKVLSARNQITEVVGMIQKEVAERICSPEGNKSYGILSVLLQAFYSIEYLFTVHENVFYPPPKVKSAVIRLIRNSRQMLACDEVLFIKVVKAAFNQRRKMLRNSLSSFGIELPDEFATKRPEQLSVEHFITLTSTIEQILKN